MIDHYCGIVKDESKGALPTIAFYGYIADGKWVGENDHRGIAELHRSPNLDMLSAPHTYMRRKLGEDGAQRQYLASAALHGKFFMDEGDDMTHLEMRKARPDIRCSARTMADSLALDILSKNALANVLVLSVGYDVENLTDNTRAKKYNGEIETDRYGRKIPKGAHGSVNFGEYTSSVKKIVSAACELFKEISDDALLIRRLSVSANVVYKNGAFTETILGEQLGMFDEPNNTEREKDEKISRSVIEIKNKYGKNALLKGVSLEEGATQIKRNGQIGGHKA